MVDVQDEDAVLPVLTPSHYSTLKHEGTVHSGMVPKLDNCFKALLHGSGISESEDLRCLSAATRQVQEL